MALGKLVTASVLICLFSCTRSVAADANVQALKGGSSPYSPSPASPTAPQATGVPFGGPTRCGLGGRIGAAVNDVTGLDSASSFYRGSMQSVTSPYVGVFADCSLATFGNTPGPFSSWVLSVLPTIDLMHSNTVPYSGLGGGFPVSSSGSMTQVDYLGLLKLTTVLTPEYRFSIFGGAGASTIRPFGTPTGPGGPSITSGDTVAAFRIGVELSRMIASGYAIGLQAAYQRNAAATFATTLDDERFKLKPSNKFLLGLILAFGGPVATDFPPAPPPTSQAGNLTPKRYTLPQPEKQKYVCGPDITEKVYLTLKKIEAEYDAASADQKKAACTALYSPTDYNHAWDIEGLDPEAAPNKEEGRYWDKDQHSFVKEKRNKYGTPVKGPDGQVITVPFKPWLTNTSDVCAIPRPDEECAATVEFDGVCMHAQVANYVMWGLVNRLCSNSYKANSDAHDAVKARGAASGTDAATVSGQQAMTDVGFAYTPKTSLQDAKDTWKNALKNASDAGAFKRFDRCTLTCPVKLGRPPFNYFWQGLQ